MRDNIGQIGGSVVHPPVENFYFSMICFLTKNVGERVCFSEKNVNGRVYFLEQMQEKGYLLCFLVSVTGNFWCYIPFLQQFLIDRTWICQIVSLFSTNFVRDEVQFWQVLQGKERLFRKFS